MANAIVDTLIFNGSIAGSASIQAQGIAGNLTFQLPNTPPIQGQLMTATAINGTTVVMGWSSAQSLSNIPLSALAQSGATNGQVIEWNGTAWTPTSTPGTSPGGSNGQIQYNNSGAFAGAANSSVLGSGAVVLGIGTNGSPTATTSLTVNGSSGANHIQDWFSQNEGFVVAHLDFNGVANLQGAVITNTINFATAALQVHGGGSGSPDIAQFFTPLGGTPSNTKVVWIDFNGNLNLLEGLKDSAASLGTSGQFLGSTGTATTWSAVDFSQLSGSLAISQINSKQGNGSKVQLSTGTTTTGDVVTYDANGNAIDSGTLLTSLAPKASPTFSGTVTAPAIAGVNTIAALGGSGLDITSSGTDLIQIQGGTVGTLNLSSAHAELTNNTSGADINLPTAGGMTVSVGASGNLALSATSTSAITLATATVAATFGGTGADTFIGANNAEVRLHSSGKLGLTGGNNQGIEATTYMVFDANADFSANHGHIAPNADMAGSVTITASTSATVNFTNTYAAAIVVVTPTSDPTAAGAYWVTQNGTSFTVHTANSTTLTFNYIVMGN